MNNVIEDGSEPCCGQGNREASIANMYITVIENGYLVEVTKEDHSRTIRFYVQAFSEIQEKLKI